MNIANLLKYCPKGTKLYSTAFGEVELFDTSSLTNTILVQNNHDTPFTFYSDGSYILDGECILFPSKDQRDWSKFRLPLKRGDIMMKADGTIPFIASGEFYKDTSPKYICGIDITGHFSTGIYGWTSEFYIPASKEAKKELFSKIAEAGYKWNINTLELEKIEPIFKEGDVVVDRNGDIILVSKASDSRIISNAVLYINGDFIIYSDAITYFVSDINFASIKDKNKLFSALVREGYKYDEKQHKLVKQEFKPFDRVLVRDKDTDTWETDIYLGYNEEDKYYRYKCASMIYKFCIPYEGNEYLLGTTDSPT